MTRGLSVFVRDNLEAFAVAIALALIVRHYSLEAFRIPSKSMMPTLIGADRGGDRILVDKYRWLRHDPHRWEPTVFHYPLNRSRNFIKRLVGLPGERLAIRDGDIWTSDDGGETWKIARKTADAREALFFPFYPAPPEERDYFAGRDNWLRGPGWTTDEGNGRFEVDAGDRSALRLRSQVTAYQSEGIYGYREIREDTEPGRDGASDLRVRFDLRVERAGTLAVVLTERGLAHRLVLGPDASRAVVAISATEERTHPLGLRVGEGMDLSVSFANVDDTLLIDVEGDAELHAAIEFPDDAEAEGTDPWRVTLEAEGMKATIEDLRIDRDVQYTQDGEWQIPDGHYFMLGDNTSSSKDSRAWEIAEVTLRDGTKIRWEEGHDVQDVPGQPDADPNWETGALPDRVIEVKADIDGLVRRFHTDDVADVRRGVHWGFVPRDHLVGRAFAIFWPIHVWPVFKSPTRVGLIR